MVMAGYPAVVVVGEARLSNDEMGDVPWRRWATDMGRARSRFVITAVPADVCTKGMARNFAGRRGKLIHRNRR